MPAMKPDGGATSVVAAGPRVADHAPTGSRARRTWCRSARGTPAPPGRLSPGGGSRMANRSASVSQWVISATADVLVRHAGHQRRSATSSMSSSAWMPVRFAGSAVLADEVAHAEAVEPVDAAAERCPGGPLAAGKRCEIRAVVVGSGRERDQPRGGVDPAQQRLWDGRRGSAAGRRSARPPRRRRPVGSAPKTPPPTTVSRRPRGRCRSVASSGSPRTPAIETTRSTSAPPSAVRAARWPRGRAGPRLAP